MHTSLNRPYYLENCLNSIVIAKKKKLNLKFVFPIMAQNIIYIKLLKNLKKLDIKFHNFNRNMGISINFLKVIKMAKGEFVWMIGMRIYAHARCI